MEKQNKKYIVMRIEKCDRAKAHHMFRHSTRKKVGNPDVDETRSYLNEYWINPRYINSDDLIGEASDDVAKLYKEKTNKKLSSIAKPIIQAYIFPSHDPSMSNAQYKELLDKSLNNVLNYLKEHNIEVIHYSYHFDEKTPHIHLFFKNQDSITGKTLRNFLNKSELSKIQSVVAENVPFGFERGEVGTSKKHISLNNMKKIELKKLKSEINKTKEQKRKVERQYSYYYGQKRKLKSANKIYYIKNKKLSKKISDREIRLLRIEKLINETLQTLNQIQQELDKRERLLNKLEQRIKDQVSTAKSNREVIKTQKLEIETNAETIIKQREEINSNNQILGQQTTVIKTNSDTIKSHEDKLNEIKSELKKYRTLMSNFKVFAREELQNKDIVKLVNNYGRIFNYCLKEEGNYRIKDIIPTVKSFLEELKKFKIDKQAQYYQAVENEGNRISNMLDEFINSNDMEL